MLSLSVISSHQIQKAGDDRTFYRFECAWDSSMHNSTLLNRVTPAKDWIYLTITCYIELEHFVQPACITKDLSLIFHARDTRVTLPRSLRSLLYGGAAKPINANMVSAVYRLTVRKVIESATTTLSRRQGKVIVDSASSYVRGEEMLKGWRPRSDSLIFEHQWELEKLTRLQLVERTKNMLLIKSTMELVSSCSTGAADSNSNSSDSTTQTQPTNPASEQQQQQPQDEQDQDGETTYTPSQRQLLLNCIRLINHGRQMNATGDADSPASSSSISPSPSIVSSSVSTSEHNSQRFLLRRNIPNINVSNIDKLEELCV